MILCRKGSRSNVRDEINMRWACVCDRILFERHKGDGKRTYIKLFVRKSDHEKISRVAVDLVRVCVVVTLSSRYHHVVVASSSCRRLPGERILIGKGIVCERRVERRRGSCARPR
jgi:hypothetical protein